VSAIAATACNPIGQAAWLTAKRCPITGRNGGTASFCADAVAFADSSCLLPTPRHWRATTHNPLNSGGRLIAEG